MSQRLYRFVAFLIFLVLSFNALGALTNINQFFNVENANKRLETMTSQVEQQKLEYLKKSVSKLEQLNEKAQTCVTKSVEQLNVIQDLIKSEQALDITDLQDRADYKYITEQKKIYQARLADCRLFVFRSQETIAAFKSLIHQRSALSLFKRSTPIWQIFTDENGLNFKNLDTNKLYQISGIRQLLYQPLFFLLGFMLLATIVAIFLKRICANWLTKQSTFDKMGVALVATVRTFIIPIFVLGTISLFLWIISRQADFDYTIELVSYYLFIYILLFASATFLFRPDKPATISPLKVSRVMGLQILLRAGTFGALILLSLVLTAIFRGQVLSEPLTDIVRTCFIILLSINVFWILWLFNQTQVITRLPLPIRALFKLFLLTFLAFLVVVEAIGYHALTIYIVIGLSSSLALLGLLWFAFVFMNHSIGQLNNLHNPVVQKIRFYLGVKPHRTFKELSLLKIGIALMLLTSFFITLLKVWKISPNLVDKIVAAFFDGFKVVEISIQPVRIIMAFLVSPILFIFGRWLSSYSARHHRFQGEKDTQVAVASIITYVSFSIALLIALLIAGVNFTGLAIIAGALSVGIGLGLQNIVNNFVSGIILLLEKPIKPGDRVVVGQTEGFVKKVRIRSTQIMTLAREDVIVPNADLITEQVTNYMFRNKLWRVTCRVGVAYGSNVELVKKVLLEVASQHADIIQEEPNNPTAYFMGFGESSLLFELWCIIQDVNKKFQILSDIHFAIDAAFRQHNIVIAFPQRDIHIKPDSKNIVAVSQEPKNE